MKRHNSRIFIFNILALLIVISGITFAPGILLVQAGGWNTPISISSSQVTSWFPDITADSTGKVHVAWAGGTTGFDTVLYTSTTDGKNWEDINDIAAIPQNGSDSASTRPSIWVDASGYLNLSYVSTTLYFSRAPIINAGKAQAWSDPIKLNSNQVAYFSRIIQDNQGKLHLFYTENTPGNGCAQCYHLFHRASKDNGETWSDSVDVSNDSTGVAKPQVIADPKGNLFAAWESGIGGGLGQLSDPTVVKFAASYDNGNTWIGAQIQTPTGVQDAKNIAIEIDGDGRLVLVFLALPDDTVDYSVSNDSGKTWSDVSAIDGIIGSWNVYPSHLDDYSMATDSSGAIHLVLIGQESSNSPVVATKAAVTPTPVVTSLNVMHLTWQRDGWSQPDIITSFTGDVPEWPRITISNGNILNTVWFVRDQANIWNSDNAHYRIWYSRKEIGAPTQPTVIPTYQATATPTTVNSDVLLTLPTVGASTNSLPTLSPSQKDPGRQPAVSENEYLAIFAKSIALVALMIIVIALVYFLKHRH